MYGKCYKTTSVLPQNNPQRTSYAACYFQTAYMKLLIVADTFQPCESSSVASLTTGAQSLYSN